MNEQTLAALHGMAYALLRLRNVGGELSVVQKRYQATALAGPAQGQLVIELSTIGAYGASEDADRRRIGYFVREAMEPQDDAGPERVTYIRTLDSGEVIRWTNAVFMRLPSSVEEAATFFDAPCACGEVRALSCGTALTVSGRHAHGGCVTRHVEVKQ